ncbi:MAG TPA: flagellar type III secretion system pore protein FliP [Nocardioidaceae bacterium]|nr:flagellar type III secretion system pore protein FliP [Nocardioidaceae bacterium]
MTECPTCRGRSRRTARAACWLLGAVLALLVLPGAAAASAAPATTPPADVPSVIGRPAAGLHVAAKPDGPTAPRTPHAPKGPQSKSNGGDVTVKFDDLTKKPSTPVLTIIGLTLLSLLPAILLTCTSFTKILVVLGLTRNALGLQQIPPNQVLAGLALFLSLFIMSPVLGQMNHDGLQPYLHGTKSQSQAWHDGVEPLRGFMLEQTGDKELGLLTDVAHEQKPKTPDDVPLTTLIPAFILSELKQAFIIGFMIFIPFLVIDIVVSAGLMSLGMMMMPPVMVSLPFKLLLFVMVDGWGLIVKSLVQSYGG